MSKSLIALFAVTSAVKLNTEFSERNLWEQHRDEGWEFDIGKLKGSLDPRSFIIGLCNPDAYWGADDPFACEEFLNQKFAEFKEKIDKRRCVSGHMQETEKGNFAEFIEAKFCFEEED